jgi:hypothetical protein
MAKYIVSWKNRDGINQAQLFDNYKDADRWATLMQRKGYTVNLAFRLYSGKSLSLSRGKK